MTGTEIAAAKRPRTVSGIVVVSVATIIALILVGAVAWGIISLLMDSRFDNFIVPNVLLLIALLGASTFTVVGACSYYRDDRNNYRARLVWDEYVGRLSNAAGVKDMPSPLTGNLYYLCVVGGNPDETISVEQRDQRVIVHTRGVQAGVLADQIRTEIGGATLSPWLAVA
jgi:hypothetical protein